MLMKAVEARKKAEVALCTQMNADAHTHGPLHKKSLSHYSLDGFPLSLLFVRSFPPFIFFFYTLTKSKDSGPQALFF